NRVFINTGSQPFLPVIDGLITSQRVFTSTDLLEQSVLAKDILIIGGGFIGLEFADMYANFGAKVTILDSNDVFLSKEDKDVADEIYKVLTAKDIKILTGVSIKKVEDISNEQVRLHYKDKEGLEKSLEASAILVATGRKPNT